ncbi:zeta toxin family protein [Terribacillus saccharophilus]|uniref:zeta toxin family protein n=1 Tax=Terribacillus saccharophilus TaxID=361277 RepID=UPI000C9BADA7|nr:zeta toxin family protein [Terribacillus goriensis]
MVNLAQELSHIYWIGGSPCAGKTTIARKLTAEYGFTYYKCDDCYDDHMSRSTPDQQPYMYKIKDQTWDQVWSTQFCSLSVEEQIEDVIRVYEEQFSLILEDLLSRPKTTPILVEGAALLPHKVAPLLTNLNHAIWMVPTLEFQIEHYKKREWIHRILDQYDDPDLAFSNWMERDSGFAHKIVKDAEDMNMRSLSVDGSFFIDQSYKLVKTHFELK